MKRISAILLALMLCISVLSISAFAAFDSVQSLAVVGSGIPGVKEWDPADPAGDMTKVSNGVYEKVLSLPAGTTMSFKIAGNDTWDDSCNFGSGAALELGAVSELPINTYGGDMTFTADSAMNIKITVDISGDTATIKVEKTDEAPADKPADKPADAPSDAPAAEGNVKVHAYVPAGCYPSFWAWQNSTQKNAFTAWPGEAMTQDGDWWTIEVPNWCDGMIVNNGSDNQTQDLLVEAGKEVWIVVNPYDWRSSSFYYELPNLEDVLPTEPPADEEGDEGDEGADDIYSRPTLGATTPKPDNSNTQKQDLSAKKNKALTIIGTAVLAVVAVSFVLSIPKKIR